MDHSKNKVLLIRPNERGFKESNITGIYLPIGLACISAVLRNNYIDVKIIDAHVNNLDTDEILREIEKNNPDVIGLTCTSLLWSGACYISNEIKRCFPDRLLILGGVQATLYPVESLENSGFDIAVYGEGEITILEIIDVLQKDGDFEDVKGLAYKKDGRILKNLPRKPVNDLDKLPFPALDLLPLEEYYSLSVDNSFVPVITSRGCSYNCSFCSPNYLGPYRERSAENVVDEVEYYVRNGIKEIVFFDENFTSNENRVIEVCRLILQRKLKFDWNIRTRIDSINERILELLKLTGCKTIHLGIESGVDKTLQNMNKQINARQIRVKTNLIKRYGMQTRGYFMLGYPGENILDTFKTVFFSLSLPLDWASFSITVANPATLLYDLYLSKFGVDYWKQNSLNCSNSNNKAPVFNKKRYFLFFLNFIKFSAYIIFYLNPRVFLKKIYILPFEVKKIIRLFSRLVIIGSNKT